MNRSSTSLSSELGKESAQRLRTILDALPIAVMWARLDDRHIIFMNRKFTQLYGYNVGDFTTVHEWVMKTYPNPDHLSRAELSWYKFYDNPNVSKFEPEPVEIDILCKDGTVKTAILGGVILPKDGLLLATFVDITDRKRDERLIRQLAEQDPLTGLSNRRSFDLFLELSVADTLQKKQTMHLLLLDLDDFKEVNDTYGHQTGDQFLQEAAKRFKTCARSSDTIARFGGDEFAIILLNSCNDMTATRICRNIMATVEQPFKLPEKDIYIGISIGVARCPDDATDAHSLITIANRLLYKSKKAGRARWSFNENQEK